MSLAVPTVGAAGVAAVAVRAGCVGLAAQLGLYALFKRSKDPVLSSTPGYTAHQVVAFFLMIFVTVLGLLSWLNPPAVAATAAGRLLAPSDSARWLGAMLLGMLVAWDIPTCLKIGRLRKPDALGHPRAWQTLGVATDKLIDRFARMGARPCARAAGATSSSAAGGLGAAGGEP